MTMVDKTREHLTRCFYDLFPDGWWVSMYGHPYRQEKRWRLRPWPLRYTAWVPAEGERVEMTPRVHLTIRCESNKVIPSKSSVTFEDCVPGVYDRLAVHASDTGEAIDMCVKDVKLPVPGAIVISDLDYTAT